MSEGSVFVRGDGRACAVYKDAKGKTRYLYAKTKREARRRLRQALKDRDDGVTLQPKTTVAALLDEWLEDMRPAVSRRYHVNIESIVRRHLKPCVGGVNLAKLTAGDARKLHKRKSAEGLQPSTVRRIHDTLEQAVRYAVRRKYLYANPLEDARPPVGKARAMDVLTPEQVNRLLAAACGDRFEAVYALGALCGLRIGEALSLRYEDIDLIEGTISIRRTLWRNRTYPPKTGASAATIRIPARVLDILRKHAAHKGHPSEGWLFPTKHGNPASAGNFQKHWKAMLLNAGLPESFTFHQLRHTTASLLLNKSVPVPVVSKCLRSARQPRHHYEHVRPHD